MTERRKVVQATQALTREGHPVNRAGRDGVAAAMRRLLEEGTLFVDPTADVAAADLRGWTARLRQLSMDLADCIEASARNRVMETLESAHIGDDWNALHILRTSVVGASPNQLGAEVGVAGRTIERIEEGLGCRVEVAWKLANHFALGTNELFHHLEGPSGRDTLHVRTVGALREVLATPGDQSGLRFLPDGDFA
jgi:DNA-binding XRE family transcriptional regulator